MISSYFETTRISQHPTMIIAILVNSYLYKDIFFKVEETNLGIHKPNETCVFSLLLTTPQVEFPCVSFQNMTTSQSFKQCVSNIPEFAYCKSCMLSSRCTYTSTAGKKLTSF